MTRNPQLRRIVFLLVALVVAAGMDAQTALSYYPLTPCRIVDTRGPGGVNGSPALGEETQRNFAIRGQCGVPTTAKAVSINITVTQATTSSWLALWPSGQSRPGVSTISFDNGDPALANGAIVGLSASPQDLSVYNRWGTVHVIIDVNGYFQ